MSTNREYEIECDLCARIDYARKIALKELKGIGHSNSDALDSVDSMVSFYMCDTD